MDHTPTPSPLSAADSLISGIAQAVVTGALTLVDPAAFTPRTRRVLRGCASLATGALTVAAWKYGMRNELAEGPGEQAQASAGAPEGGHGADPGQQSAQQPTAASGEASALRPIQQPAPDGRESADHDSGTPRISGTAMAVGVGGGMAALTYGWLLLGEKIDAGIHRALANRGVQRPRVVMAVAAAGLSMALFEVDRRSRDDDAAPAPGEVPTAGEAAAS